MNTTYISSIYKLYLVIGLLLFGILTVSIQGTENYLLLINIFLVTSYGYLLYFSSQRNEEYFTMLKLGLTVFIYSTICVLLYYDLSFYYNNDIMVFCYSDASLYKSTVEKMYSDDDFLESFQRISRWGHDDWGAPVSMLAIYSIIPSKIFLNFVFIILGTVSSLSLFSIGKRIMHIKYAYIAALTFGISSYWIWFHSSFLKETIMVFIVIESFYFFYKFLDNKNYIHLILAILISLFLIFFRPAIIGFIWVAYSAYFMTNSGNKVLWLFYTIIIISVALFTASYMKDIFDNYTHGGDVTTIKSYIGVTRFSFMTNAVAALIGPFPNLVSIPVEIAYKHLYGPSLLLKYMLFVPFWYGLYYATRYKHLIILPLFVFCILEIISLVFINNGLVLRKAMPHVPIYIMCAIWMASLCDDEKTNINHSFVTITKFSWVIVFVSTIIWNLFK